MVKRIIYLLLIILSLVVLCSVIACTPITATLAWDETLTISDINNCNLIISTLNEQVFYSVKCRVMNSGKSWDNITSYETPTTQIVIKNLSKGTTYECICGPHYEGDPVMCWTDPIYFSIVK